MTFKTRISRIERQIPEVRLKDRPCSPSEIASFREIARCLASLWNCEQSDQPPEIPAGCPEMLRRFALAEWLSNLDDRQAEHLEQTQPTDPNSDTIPRKPTDEF